VHDLKLTARLTNDPVTSPDLPALEFLERTMHGDKGSFHAIEHFMPVPTQFFGQDDLIADQVDAASGNSCDGALVSFQACKTDLPKIKSDQIAFVAVEVEAIRVVVKAIRKHCESIIDTRDAIGAHQLILKCTRDACLAR